TIGLGAFNRNALSTVNNAPSDGFIFARNEDGTENKKVVISYGGARKEVVIPDTVTIIERRALASSELTSVVIPDSVTTIGREAFAGNELISVAIPESVSTISYGVFSNNNLTSVTISDSVNTIAPEAFADNKITK
ncbi:leucine-rich repeat domain-containing protein, partial [Vibrio alginolyticus]|uniref:leucine-rich repeat domain-containing protein n=2 Tax=Vibrionaceae TaxID=641 RepID=UPI003D7D61B8